MIWFGLVCVSLCVLYVVGVEVHDGARKRPLVSARITLYYCLQTAFIAYMSPLLGHMQPGLAFYLGARNLQSLNKCSYPQSYNFFSFSLVSLQSLKTSPQNP